MNKLQQFNFSKRFNSFKYAYRGVCLMLSSQHNAWIHAVLSILVIILGFLIGVNRDEWLWLIIAITSVWTAEALNTAFEFLCDVVSPDFHPMVEKSKDVAAGAVLLTAFGATLIGLIIFLPRFIELFNKTL